jgi:hypothetical protein
MRISKLSLALPFTVLLALPAFAAQPAAPAQEGMVVVRDPQTGQMRAPTAAEIQALRQAAPAAAQAAAAPKMVVGPDGRRHVQLGESAMVYSVATRDSEGKLSRHCFKGEAAAQAALAEPAATPHQEHRHESR